jgi:ABC-type amino acid transport substrate-binding protein
MQTLCEFSPMPFPEIIPALEQGLVQFAPSNFLWTPERAARINFSEKYYRSTTSLVGLSKDSFEDPMVLLQQNEATIAAAHSSAQWRYLHQHSAAQVVSVDTIAKGMQALEKGEVDYILLPTLFALNFLQRPENTHLDFIGEPIDAKSLTGDVHIGISKTQPELKDKIDKAIQSLVSSGELRVLILKYFPFNVY